MEFTAEQVLGLKELMVGEEDEDDIVP